MAKNFATVPLSLALLFCFTTFALGADVKAPATGQAFTVTVSNFSTVDLDGVGVKVVSESDPNDVLLLHDSFVPASMAVPARCPRDFHLGFDVQCPTHPKEFETVKLRFSVTSSSPGPLYVRECGFNTSSCDELEAEITVDTSRCSRISLGISGVENGKIHSGGVAATITATEESPILNAFSGTFGDDGQDDFLRQYDSPTGTDAATHLYNQYCSTRFYGITATASDLAGHTEEATLTFGIAKTECPGCFTCSDSPWGAACRQDPGARDCRPPIWRSSPDDNVDLATNPPIEITSLASYDRSSPIGVLRNGYYTEMFELLASFNARAALVGIDFDPSIVEQIRVLVIPTGGLFGLDNSELFRSALAEYANRGGTIVSLSQAYGNEFTALPGSPGGYGWLQDTACFSKAFYIERYHQFLSGQHIVGGTSDAEVDGYFTDLPLGARVYLRRTRNGQPGLVEYPYGFAGGMVIATTAYADWAFANGQAALDSRHLVRDILAWTFDPKELAEYRPGDISPARRLQVMHFGGDMPGADTPAAAELMRLSVLTPDRRPYLEMTVPVHVEAGTLVEAELPAFALPAESTETLGIWWVDYTLLDAGGGTVQDPVRWHRFVVSPADVSPYEASDYYFSIQTDSDAYPVGGRAEFTFLVFNNTDRDRVIAVRPDLGAPASIPVPAFGRGQLMRALDPVRQVNGSWRGGGWVSAAFYDEGSTFLGTTTKSFGVYVPAVELDVLIARPEYGRGETVPIELRMLNKSPANQRNDFSFTLLDPSGAMLLERRYSFDSGPDAQHVETLEHALGAGAPEGAYRATLEAFDDRGNKFASTSRTFLLPRALLAVRPVWPAAFSLSNVVGFEVQNVGTGGVGPAQFTARLRAPDGSIVWTDDAAIGALGPAAAESVSFVVQTPVIHLGSYTFEYELAYEGKIAAAGQMLSSSLGVALSLESAEAMLNTTLGLKVTLANEGRFRQTATIVTRIPDTGFQSSRALVVEPGSSETFELRPDVPATVPVGAHRIEVEAVLASGERVSASQDFRVLEPGVAIDVALESPGGRADVFRIRDALVPRIRLLASKSFAGPLDATCRIEIPAAGYVEAAPVTLYPGATVALPAAADSFPRPLTVPESLPAGRNDVRVSLDFPNGYSESVVLALAIADSKFVLSSAGENYAAGDAIVVEVENVGGVDADYVIEYLELDDQDWNTIASASGSGRLLAGERRVLGELAIPAAAGAGDAYLYASVSDGHPQSYLLSKRVRIAGASASLNVATGHEVYTRAEGVSGSAEVVTGPLGVEDASLTIRVEHFNDGTGKEFRRVAPRDPYFNFGEPQGLAVGRDGSVYVASSWENRVQKFDARGTLLAQWGAQGTGPGEFDWPMGTAIGPDGTLYVVDSYNHRIQKFDPNGNHISSWGSYGQEDGQLNYPSAIAVGPTGDVYVADTSNRQVQRFDSSGNFVSRWPATSDFGTTPETPDGIAVDQNGFLYVGTGSRILKYDGNGSFVTEFGYWGTELLTVDAGGYVYGADWCGRYVEKYDSNGNHLASLPLKAWEDGRGACTNAIAASPDDRLYSADVWYRVQWYTLDGSFLDEWKSYGGEEGRFGMRSPHDVGTFGWGFYALDGDNHRIQQFSDDGTLTAQWGGLGTDAGRFNSPTSFFFSPDWRIYVADTGNNRIQVFRGDGTFIQNWGSYGTGIGEFRSPTGVTRGRDGSVYVVDQGNSRVQWFTFYGAFLGMWGSSGAGDGQFWLPERVAVDAGGNVYVTDKRNHRVQKFDPSGAFLGKWGSYGTGDGQFDLPVGIAVTGDGNILVVDSCSTNRHYEAKNNRVVEFDNQGNFIRSWGAGLGDPRSWDPRGSAGDANGLFNRPEGVAVGADGSLYVADTGNRRVQRLSRTARYETVFESTTPLTQAEGTTATYPFNVGILDLAGQMNVVATVSNSLGQEIASAQHPFFIVDNEISISFSTDKAVYRPGEAVLVIGEARNRTDQPVDGVLVMIAQNGTNAYSELVDLPAGGSYAFSTTLTAAEEGTFVLSGSAQHGGTVVSEASVRFEVAAPALYADLYGPDVAGADPFTLELYLSNGCALPLTVTYSSSALGASGEVTLPPWESTSLFSERSIAATTEVVVEIGGDVTQTVIKAIAYGLAAEVEVSARSYYPEGRVEVPYTVTNVGTLPGSYPVAFELFDAAGASVASSRFVHHLTVGDDTAADSGSVGLDLDAGEYRLHHGTIGSEGNTAIRVARPEARAVLSGSATYPEGFVAIPIVLENVGHLPGSFAVTTRVTSGAQAIREQTSSIFLNSPDENPALPGYVGTTHAGTLALSLVPGSYRVQAEGAGVAGAAADFVVLPTVAPALAVSAGATAGGRLPVTVSVLNNGTEPFSGLIIAETGFWSGEAAVEAVLPNAAAHRQFEVPLAGAPPGTHAFAARLLDAGGNLLKEEKATFLVRGADPRVSRLSDYATFAAGGTALEDVCVENGGDQEGFVALALAAFEGSERIPASLDVGQERCFRFEFPVPDDIEEKDYDARYSLFNREEGGETLVEEGRIPFHVASVKVGVAAALDAKLYRAGETAHLTLDVASVGTLSDRALLARVRFGDHEEYRPFVLPASEVRLEFDVPIVTFEDRLLFEVLMETGRSLYINTLFVQERHDAVRVFTDRTSYLPGDEVTITVETEALGTVELSALSGAFTRSLAMGPGSPVETSFTLPADLYGGTQLITCAFGGEVHAYRFNVASPRVEFLGARLDKSRYGSGAPFRASFEVLAGAEMDGWVDGYFEGPDGLLSPAFSYHGRFAAGVTAFEISGLVVAPQTGLHKLYCLFYGDAARSRALTSAMEFFDVGSFALTQVLTDKTHYREGLDPVVLSAYLAGEAFGFLTVALDGQEVFTEPVAVVGFNQVALTIPASAILGPGAHVAQVRLWAGAAESGKEAAFDVRKRPAPPHFAALPDLTKLTALDLSGVADPFARIELWVNGAAAASAAAGPDGVFQLANVPLANEGGNQLDAVAYDGEGTGSAHTTATIERDTVAPVVAISSPQAGIVATRTPVLQFTATDGEAAVSVDGVLAAVASGEALGPFADGEHRVDVAATDPAGNTGSASVRFITLTAENGNRPPELSTPGNLQVAEGDTLRFTVAGADPDGDAVSLAVFGLPRGAAFHPGTGAFEWTPWFDQEGEYALTFQASDNGVPALLVDRTTVISVVPPDGPIFADDFADGAAPEDWVRGSGTWVAAGGVYTARSVKTTSLARIAQFEPTASPLLAGIVRARVKMTATAARSGPNGMLVFGYQSPSQYRWLKITKTQVQIGQTGILGGVGAGVKKKKAVKIPVNRFLLFTVKVYADGSVEVFKGAATRPLVSYRFPGGASGGVGLASVRARTVFDNVTVFDDSKL